MRTSDVSSQVELPARGVAFAHCRPKSANSDSRLRSRVAVPRRLSRRTKWPSRPRARAPENQAVANRSPAGTRLRVNEPPRRAPIHAAQWRQSRAQSTARKRSNASSSSSNKGTVANAKDATIKAAKSTGDAVGSTAKKLRTPAIAAGAGLAGLAGGIALTRGRQRKVLGVPLPGRGTTKSLAGAAKNIGALAEQAGHVAEQARVAGEALGGNEARRSPIEVVLQGLTRRSQAAKSD